MASTSPSSADDSDLEDLIAKSPSTKSSVDAAQSGSNASSSIPSLLHYTPLHLLCNLFQLTSYTFATRFPILSRVLTTLLLFSLLGLLTNTLVNPTSTSYHRLGADYSSITSAYDLSLSHVHHWCIEGDNDSCKCEDPLEPHPRSEFKSWNAAHKANVAEVEFYRAVYGMEPAAVDKELGRPRARLDVAFLGESVVEAMDGRWLGKKVVSLGGVSPGPDGVRVEGKRGEDEEEGEIKKKRTKSIDQIFEHFFRKDKGGYFEGCALGIAGDTTSNVLWRIQNNEMPYDFNPKVWWLLLGMNDLTRMQCSEEIVVLGILRVVEEIRLRKPDAKIVINSLLPMVNFDEMKKGDEEVKMADFADFQAKDEKGRHKYRKRQIPVDMDENNDDDRVKNKRKNDGKRRLKLQNRVLRNKQFNNKNDDNEEEIPARRAKNDKRPEQEPEPRGKTRKERLKEIDNATSGPLLEKAMERKRKYLATRDKKVRDKVFKDDEKYHPKKPISPFLPLIKKHVLPPVWPSVHLINDKLKEFCKKHDGITFFDATPIFASDEGNGKHRLYDELISPRGHPTELGFQQWEGHIMSRLHKLLAESEEEKEVVKKVPEPKMEQEEEDYQDGEDAVEGNEMEAKDGEGSEHVSEGKEAMPPEEGNGSMPDRRADPPAEAEEDEYEDENDDDDDEDSE